MTTFQTYRNGPGSLSSRIQAAVRHFYRTRQALPASIAVNGQELDAARDAMGALALGVPAAVNEGVCWGEVWLAEVAE